MLHTSTCPCSVCNAEANGESPNEARVADWEKQDLFAREYGFVVHGVIEGDVGSPTGTNFHTHGMPDSFDHLDLQIVVPVKPDIALEIFRNVVHFIEIGAKYEDGDVISGIIKGFDVKFIAATEDGRAVLRVVLPDKNGQLEKDKMLAPFGTQYGTAVKKVATLN